nr:alpha/beta fold hydrolase [Alteromonas sp. C1M14]
MNMRRLLAKGLLLLCSLYFSAVALGVTPQQLHLTVAQRDVPVWAWVVDDAKGTILFSHGAFSAPWKYSDLIDQWVAAGYSVYAPLHVDSTDHPHNKDYGQADSWPARLQDMSRVADAFGKDGYIVAGHSYGAYMALVKGGVQGMQVPGVDQPYQDPRAKVVLAFSPPGPMPGFITEQSFTTLATPAFIQTGTADIPFGGHGSWDAHLTAFHNAPAEGNKYAMVLDGVDHYFGGAICRPELPGPKQSEALKTAATMSLEIIDAYYHKDETALEKLQQHPEVADGVTFMHK